MGGVADCILSPPTQSMAAVIVGNVLFPNPTAVCKLVLVDYPETPGGLFSRKTDAKWELHAILTHSGESILVDTAATRESAVTKFVEYATALGLDPLVHDIALRRDIIVAIYASQSPTGKWRVTAQTTLSFNSIILLYIFESREDAYERILALNKKYFATSSTHNKS